jgi:hypothetical protein
MEIDVLELNGVRKTLVRLTLFLQSRQSQLTDSVTWLRSRTPPSVLPVNGRALPLTGNAIGSLSEV